MGWQSPFLATRLTVVLDAKIRAERAEMIKDTKLWRAGVCRWLPFTSVHFRRPAHTTILWATTEKLPGHSRTIVKAFQTIGRTGADLGMEN